MAITAKSTASPTTGTSAAARRSLTISSTACSRPRMPERNCNQTLPDGHTEYWGNSYIYDAWGNLNQKQVTKCSAENLSVAVKASNQLQGYSYDAAGNMTVDNSGTSYVYDAENRINSASGFTYVYDADNAVSYN